MQSDKLKIKIFTPEAQIYDGEGDFVTVPTKTGLISILPKHAGLVSIVSAGEMKIKNGDKETDLAVTDGFLRVSLKNELLVFVDTAQKFEDMNMEEIEKAKARAEKMLKEAHDKDDVDFAKFEEMLARETSRAKLMDRYIKRKS